jgi:hypothetical protein
MSEIDHFDRRGNRRDFDLERDRSCATSIYACYEHRVFARTSEIVASMSKAERRGFVRHRCWRRNFVSRTYFSRTSKNAGVYSSSTCLRLLSGIADEHWSVI